MSEKLNRRGFLKRSAQFGVSAVAGSSLVSSILGKSYLYAGGTSGLDIAAVSGQDYGKNTVKAIDLLGGIGKFVPKNSKVALLPNTQSKHPGTYTKPEILRAVIRMCKEAGAKEVNCLSWLTQKHWDSTGLAAAIAAEGATLKLIPREEAYFQAVPVPKGKALKEAKILKELYSHDVFIDMPITKDHAGNKFTGTMKNLMGLNFPEINRTFHTGDFKEKPDDVEHLDQSIADLNTVIKPTLLVVDATEFITTNGPFGPGQLAKPLKVVAGVDRIAVDGYCTTLWGMKPEDIVMIKRGYEHGLGEINLKNVRIKELSL
jgi:uncharacterized protein (DUF362 family)